MGDAEMTAGCYAPPVGWSASSWQRPEAAEKVRDMTDKIMAFVALATMITFLATVAVFVPHIDLILVITFVSLLAIYDFWTSLRDRSKNRGKG